MLESGEKSDLHGGVDFNTPSFFTAAHELKSPLALIRQLSLSLELGDIDREEVERTARQITLTTERALRLTTDLTKSTRLEDSLFSLEPLNPISLCDEVVKEIQPLYEAKGREIKISKRSRPLLAIANRELLRRVLLNFADNALHYGDESPVMISAHTHSGGSKVRLCVRDWGPSLPAKSVNSTSLAKMSSRPESSGLGIYVARQFAEAMDASIGATRHRDGASFYIDLSSSTQMRLI